MHTHKIHSVTDLFGGMLQGGVRLKTLFVTEWYLQMQESEETTLFANLSGVI